MTHGWAVKLNDVILADCVWSNTACDEETGTVLDGLTDTPDGITGSPGLRTEDVTYAQRDGVRHFNDWYLPRFVTLTGQLGPTAVTDCVDGECGDIREQVQTLMQAWKRQTEDVELVVYSPCNGDNPCNTGFGEGPFGEGPFGECWTAPLPPTDSGELEFINLATDPRATEFRTGADDIGPSDWYFQGVYTTETTDLPPGEPFTTYARKTSNTTDTGSVVLPLTGQDLAGGLAVEAGVQLTISAWGRFSITNASPVLQFEHRFFDAGNNQISNPSVTVSTTENTWARVDDTVTVPALAVEYRPLFKAGGTGGNTSGDTIDLTGLMITTGSDLVDYFDGSSGDNYDATLDGWYTHQWVGDVDASNSYAFFQAARYEGSTLNGPFGIVGRPRVAEIKPQYRDDSIYDFLLRFDSVDQRMYVLDTCGTPGFEKCSDVDPGTTVLCHSEPICSPVCSTEESVTVDPVTIAVGGTEVTYPTITLWPNMTDPIIENMTTLNYVKFNGPVVDFPVFINTEDMTAEQNGLPVTHLLSGTLDFHLSPGEFQLRMLTASNTDTGYMTICFRDTVITA